MLTLQRGLLYPKIPYCLDQCRFFSEFTNNWMGNRSQSIQDIHFSICPIDLYHLHFGHYAAYSLNLQLAGIIR